MTWSPVTLSGHGLTLVPLTAEHAPDLYAVTPPDNFQHFLTWPNPWNPATFTAWITQHAANPANMPFAVLDSATSRAVGSSTFHDMAPAHRHAEIGSTWYGSTFRGTHVNPACKLLMLTHAFDTMGCIRVTIKCDARNERSARAIAKLGAVREGIIRYQRIRQDGTPRNTIFFSIIRDEWPAVKAGLQQRVASAGL